ncbi:hypothetical protein NLJ89_g6159 [Agrocybe chaxingu]|uniref:F-box domain-containing protein n=1 Tax=Agrocybe chaxingu TaxID=84603 RepID=A0A9W8K6Z4_9AGAR|nr:hypothetical protein NLJ89_g6159 [Agrocybe chaxingu]
MTPRTRSNRSGTPEKQALLANGQPVLNIKGLPALPDEIYLEIASYLPAIPIPTTSYDLALQAHHDRHITLTSLSTTCRSLRRVFLRYLWQRIEVVDGMQTIAGPLTMLTPKKPTEASKMYAEELVRQLEIVTIREPELAAHVNVLNVTILEYAVKTIVPELARCIALFPNLHTIQLNFKIKKNRLSLLDVFKEYTYPQIRHACLSESAVAILPSLTGIRRLDAYMNTQWNLPIEDALGHPGLEVLASTPFDETAFTHIVEKLPNVREIQLDRTLLRLGYDEIKKLSDLKHLHTIRIVIDMKSSVRYFYHFYDNAPANPLIYSKPSQEEIRQWVEWTKKALTNIKSSDNVKKRVVLVRADGHEEAHTVH